MTSRHLGRSYDESSKYRNPDFIPVGITQIMSRRSIFALHTLRKGYRHHRGKLYHQGLPCLAEAKIANSKHALHPRLHRGRPVEVLVVVDLTTSAYRSSGSGRRFGSNACVIRPHQDTTLAHALFNIPSQAFASLGGLADGLIKYTNLFGEL